MKKPPLLLIVIASLLSSSLLVAQSWNQPEKWRAEDEAKNTQVSSEMEDQNSSPLMMSERGKPSAGEKKEPPKDHNNVERDPERRPTLNPD